MLVVIYLHSHCTKREIKTTTQFSVSTLSLLAAIQRGITVIQDPPEMNKTPKLIIKYRPFSIPIHHLLTKRAAKQTDIW